VKFPFLTSHFLFSRLTSWTCPQVFSSTISFSTAVVNPMWIFKQVFAHKKRHIVWEQGNLVSPWMNWRKNKEKNANFVAWQYWLSLALFTK